MAKVITSCAFLSISSLPSNSNLFIFLTISSWLSCSTLSKSISLALSWLRAATFSNFLSWSFFISLISSFILTTCFPFSLKASFSFSNLFSSRFKSSSRRSTLFSISINCRFLSISCCLISSNALTALFLAARIISAAFSFASVKILLTFASAVSSCFLAILWRRK